MGPETHFYPSLYAEYSNDTDLVPEFDPEGAKAVLEEAGYTPDADGNYITGFTMTSSTATATTSAPSSSRPR